MKQHPLSDILPPSHIKVYLAGKMPTESLKNDSWRKELKSNNSNCNHFIEWLDPEEIPYKHSGDEPFVVEEDLKLISGCDVVLACFNEEGQYGTIAEVLIGLLAYNKKVLLITNGSNYWFLVHYLKLLNHPNVVHIGDDINNISNVVYSLHWKQLNGRWELFFDKEGYITRLEFRISDKEYQLEEKEKQIALLNEELEQAQSQIRESKMIIERIRKNSV